MDFISLNNEAVSISQGAIQLQQKGALVYEYNPLKVLRLGEDLIESDKVTYPKGSLVDLDTELLPFDLNHPVDIIPQQSYDGSVNLILNDGNSFPKLINTRFSSTGMNTYQIVDRSGDNDTNIYDESSFDSDVSLYKKLNTIPRLMFTGLGTSGNLRVGNYVFYFKLSDSDGNESDFIAESGIVTCHIGNINDPFSIQGGIRDENSYKSVSFILTNIDSSYNNVVVYYTRSTSDANANEIVSSFKIDKNFAVYNNIARVNINGFENITQVSLNDINMQYNVVDSANAQTACQNMLFMGNVNNPEIEYKELSDLSLRFLPHLNLKNNIGWVNEKYEDSTGQYEYYNVQNIYHKLGYWNEEIYRFGIVYILNDFTLSPVFNVRGISDLVENVSYTKYKVYKNPVDPNSSIEKIKANREYIPTNKDSYKLDNQNENSKGVVRINYSGNQLQSSGIVPIGIDFKIDKEALALLKRFTKGFFFVRQKRIPTTLCQAVTIGLESTSHLPVLPVNNGYLVERFIDDDGVLTNDFSRRYKTISSDYVSEGYAALCPEFELRQPYFNQLFTGTEFEVSMAKSQFRTNRFNNLALHYYNLDYTTNSSVGSETYNITAITDNIKLLKGKKEVFSSRAGEAEEQWRVSYYEYRNKSKNARNLLRGAWGPFLGIEGYNTNKMSLINIKIPSYNENSIDDYFSIRFEDSSSFYAICDRTLWEDVDESEEMAKVSGIFRGDCFIGNYTHRMCRNFQDPSSPINDDIVDAMSWKDNYDPDNQESFSKINRGDVNAITLGHWATIKVCSNINISMRCLDKSYSSEEGLTGKPRGFYPLQAMSTGGESKIPESFVVNDGINSTTSDKYNFELPDVPAIKNHFGVRIMYSDININDSFKNGYRVFRLTNYRDYPLTYGNIIKLVELFGNILCVFEHGVALIPVNERVESGSGAGGSVFINTSNVLPENPRVLSDTFGTQWAESVIKTPYFVYGVDIVGKKIWRTNGETFEVISDFKVQKFLNDNISLTEKEMTPIIGIRNVKTHYNRFKQDVMFTFYDDINTIEEKVWNLCYNEVLQKFITFYSWVPSYSENIDNIFFTFDRDTSKAIAKLTKDYPLITLSEGNLISPPTSTKLGSLRLNMNLEEYLVDYYLADDRLRNQYFISTSGDVSISEALKDNVLWSFPVKAEVYHHLSTSEGNSKVIDKTVYSTITVATQEYYNTLTTSFWKHGKAGLMETKEPLRQTYWYGKQHPFEFEVVVVDNPSVHKLFENLVLLSNNVAPESFHYEITGDVYDFANDRENMYFRQEATKDLYQYNGSDILYDSDYLKLHPKQRDIIGSTSPYKERSTMFPLYYTRVDTINEIEDYYQAATSPHRDYQSLSGSEIVYDKRYDSYHIVTHVKGCPFKGMYKQRCKESDPGAIIDDSVPYPYIWAQYGRLRGNMDFIEDNWYIQIPPINFYQKNELQWKVGKEGAWYPPLNLTNNPLPNDMSVLEIKTENDIPKELVKLGYGVNVDSFDTTKWETISNHRKESKIKDKVMKIKIRYAGDKLVYVTALKTIYNISYA